MKLEPVPHEYKPKKNLSAWLCRLAFITLILLAQHLDAQYFGKNKVNYEKFTFEIYRTPHFKIYHYLDNREKLEDFGQLAERWYERHQAILLDTLRQPSPIILYNNHADFQQTTVIQSIIGVGTGGVTEGLRNRVVMPLMKSNAETNHVLGHELVHVFQYHMFKHIDTLDFESIGSIPLWMIEGLSEYMSIGTDDPHTAVWMRDAVLQDDIPTLEDMTRRPYEYFPYRYGHAFWAFIAARWGDEMIKPLLLASGMVDYRRAIDSLLGLDTDSLSILWKESILQTHGSHLEKGRKKPAGEKLFDNPGGLNFSPSVSPDGNYVIFLSDRDVITIDFYLADMSKKRILRRLTRDIRDTHIDNYSYLESTGTWSPDSKKYALTLFSDGRKKLMIFEVRKSAPERVITIDELDYFDNPAWSPDGKSIVLAGLQQGQSDLYRYQLETGELRQLTDDYYSDLQPAWSPDGSKLVFISDRGFRTDPDRIHYGRYRLCEYRLQDDSVNILRVFPGADVYSPDYASDGESIYFISAANGIQNIYSYALDNGDCYRLSNVQTGINSISALSPALSVARNIDLMVYVLYENKGYSIYRASSGDFSLEKVNPVKTDLAAARLVPEEKPGIPTVVDINLERYPLKDESRFKTRPYDPSFGLEAIGSVGIGIGYDQTNTMAAGGMSFLFSDMLRRNQLFTAVRINGRITDVGGQVVYINQKSRLNWGASFSHIPYLSILPLIRYDTIESIPIIELIHMERRIFEDQLSVFGMLPLSKKLRFEGGASASIYSYRTDSVSYFYSNTGYYLGEEKQQIDSPEPFTLYNAYIANVGDNSLFGLTSPLRGYRYRFQVGRTQGRFKYWELLADYRHYYFFKPFGFAYRALHYGRYGESARDFNPLYLGYPYYVRGYEYSSVQKSRCEDGNCLSINQITGSKMLIAGAEVRLPLTGPKRLAMIKSRFLFTDLVGFVDGGLAWHYFNDISFSFDPAGEQKIPVYSLGIAVRVNLFGLLILEPYYAIPLQDKAARFGRLGFYISGGGW